ncbi:MAG TPA: twin-arginine translocation signal domain-containing protein, partial [Verrucomicrobiota bacterium]|nr:twin-arginine translocation signal domain-containing protein [Verrucomicrobiota bacterium]
MPTRRDFIKSTTLAAGTTALTTATTSQAAKPDVKTKNDTFRKELLECLGGPWPESGDLKPKKLKTEQKEGYRLEWITYELEPGDRCPAI